MHEDGARSAPRLLAQLVKAGRPLGYPNEDSDLQTVPNGCQNSGACAAMRSNEFAKGPFALSAGNLGTVFRIMEHAVTVALKENRSELSREHFEGRRRVSRADTDVGL